MNIKLLRKMVQEVLAEAETETQPTTAPPTTAPGKPKPRRPLGNPDVKPNPKAVKAVKAVNEEEMLAKIIDRFKSKK
jgi:hypothetical protein